MARLVLSSNLNNKKNLDKILLPGLSTIGIPKKMEGLAHHLNITILIV